MLGATGDLSVNAELLEFAEDVLTGFVHVALTLLTLLRDEQS